jgi:hypothetical protein
MVSWAMADNLTAVLAIMNRVRVLIIWDSTFYSRSSKIVIFSRLCEKGLRKMANANLARINPTLVGDPR